MMSNDGSPVEKLTENIAVLSDRYHQRVVIHGQFDSQAINEKVLLSNAHYELGEFEFQQGHHLEAARHYLAACELTNHNCAYLKLYKKKQSSSLDIESNGRMESVDEGSGALPLESDECVLKGLCYLAGLGVIPNEQEALRLFQHAANQGDMVAQRHLGWMYQHGRVQKVSKLNTRKLMERWYGCAADQGDMVAQTYLGLMYEQGGVDVLLNDSDRDQRAMSLIQSAAAQGYPPAQYHLGRMLESPYGEDPQGVVAQWFRCAAEQGHNQAQIKLDMMYVFRRVAGASESEVADAFMRCQAEAERGHPLAQHCLAKIYWCNLVPGTSNAESDCSQTAISWYQRAALQGHEDSYFALLSLAKRRAEPKVMLSAEYALFKLFQHKKNESEALKYFNRNPMEHLIKCCNELVDFLLDTERLNEQVVADSVAFIEFGMDIISKRESQLRPGFFSTPLGTEKLQYAIDRVSAYLGQPPGSALEAFQRLESSRYFTGDDAFHLAQCHFAMVEFDDPTMNISSSLNDNLRLGQEAMIRAADMGCVLAQEYLRVQGEGCFAKINRSRS